MAGTTSSSSASLSNREGRQRLEEIFTMLKDIEDETRSQAVSRQRGQAPAPYGFVSFSF